MDIKELAGQIEVKGEELRQAFTRAKECKDGQGEELALEINKRNDELTELQKKFEGARALEKIEADNERRMEAMKEAKGTPNPLGYGGGAQDGGAASLYKGRTLGDIFAEVAGKSATGAAKWSVDLKGLTLADFDRNRGMELKTTMTTAAGFAPQSIRTGIVVDYATRRPMVADLIPTYVSDQHAFVYMEETTFTNNAAGVAENSASAESALAYTERSVTHEEISTFIPVTNIQMEDVPGLAARINNRLGLMLMLKEETDLLSGDGNTPNINGFYTQVTQAQAKGADSVPDAIYKGFTKVRHTGFGEPTGIVLHPNDWQTVRLLTTTDGIYIFGSPAEAGPETMWGKPVVVTTAATENTALVGDFQMYSELSRRKGINIEVGYNSDDLTKRKKTVLISERLALAVLRASAFCEVTGI